MDYDINDTAPEHKSGISSAARGEHGELREVRLTVIDNGPGFPDKVLKRAFEPYVTTKPKGTGLGLAVVKKIADEHGARVRTANLREGDRPDAPVTGARVSLSFSNFVTTSEVADPGPGGGGAVGGGERNTATAKAGLRLR